MPNLQSKWVNLIKEHQVLVLMLFLGLMMGLIFVNLVPPWQHYDEPTHFEYAWIIANRDGIPGQDEYDQAVRREIAASMIEFSFFSELGFTPNLFSTSKPIWLGLSQTGSNPVYYWLAAIPLRILRTTDVTFQLFILRYVSILFYLVTIVAAHGIAVELTPQKHPLRWLLPTTILLLPGIVDILTAVNDDVGAIAFFSLFLWTGVRLLRRGFNWLRLSTLLVLAVICFYTKNTVMIAVILFFIPVLFSVIQGRNRRYIWIGLAGLITFAVVSLISWGDPASWHRTSPLNSTTRFSRQDAQNGDYVFKFTLSPDTTQAQFFQYLPTLENGSSTYTIGAWIWADQAATVRSPMLQAGDEVIVDIIEVSDKPTFFSVSGEINNAGPTSRIILSPIEGSLDNPFTVYYDGIVVVVGNWTNDSIPQFNDDSAHMGVWGSKQFTNLVRNPSGEDGRLRLRTWIEPIIADRFPGNPALITGLIQDPTSISFYYELTTKSLLQSFWAKFGWAHVNLQGYRPYTILGLFTMVGLIGASAAFLRSRRKIRWDIFLFLGLALILVWGAAFLRGLPSVLDGRYFIPVARYAYPVIIPTMLILNIGWLEVISWIERLFRIPQKGLLALLILFFIFLDIYSIYTIYTFYI